MHIVVRHGSGERVGANVGARLGELLGNDVGESVGTPLGCDVGEVLDSAVGSGVGEVLGSSDVCRVGASVSLNGKQQTHSLSADGEQPQSNSGSVPGGH